MPKNATSRDYIKVNDSLQGDPVFDEALGTKKVRVFKPSGEYIDYQEGVIAVVNYMISRGLEPAVCGSTEIRGEAQAFFKQSPTSRQQFYPTSSVIGKRQKAEVAAPPSAETATAPRRRGRPRKNPVPAETAVPPAPRRRGRPRKNPAPVEAVAAPEEATAPRRRGRPRKNPVPAPAQAPVAAVRRRGRPPKNPVVAAEAPRRRGRPRKNPVGAEAAVGTPAPARRRRRQRSSAPSDELSPKLRSKLGPSVPAFVSAACLGSSMREIFKANDHTPQRVERMELLDKLLKSVSNEIESSGASWT